MIHLDRNLKSANKALK